MNEDRLKRALTDQADAAQPTPAKWEAVRARSAAVRRGRRTQRIVIAGLSTAAVIAVVVGLLLATGERSVREGLTDDPTPTPDASAAPGGPPPYVLVATSDGKLSILDSTSGDAVRTVADGLDVTHGSPQLAASSDGRYVYADRMKTSGPCANETREIVRYDAVSGDESVVGEGSSFSLSPDGQRLAYVTGPPCTQQSSVVVRSIEGTGEVRWASDNDERPEMLSWSPANPLQLSVLLVAGESTSLRVLGPTTDAGGGRLQDAREIPVPEFVTPFGFLGAEEFLGVEAPEDQTDVIGFSEAGRRTRLIGRIPGIADVLNAVSSADGKHVLVARQTPGGAVSAAEDMMRSFDIVSEGVDAPRTIAGSDVLAATWLEHPTSPDPAVDATNTSEPAPDANGEAPDTIVAAWAEGPIVELDRSSGSIVRTIAARAPQPGLRNESIALSPDSKYVFFEVAGEDGSRGCDVASDASTVIKRVLRTGGPVESVVTGRWPAISPDGRSLAFVSYESCDAPGRLAVIAAQNGEDSQIWTAPEGISIEGPLSWDTAGDSVLVHAQRGERWAWSWVDTTSDERVVSGLGERSFDTEKLAIHSWQGSGGLAYLQRHSDRAYGFFLGDGTDLINGVGSVDLGDGTALSFDPDDTFTNCLFVVDDGASNSLWSRRCVGDDPPSRVSGSYTAAVW